MNCPARTRSADDAQPLEIALSGGMTIEHAADQARRLRAALTHSGPVQLDLGEVIAIDVTGVQLLLATTRSLASHAWPVTLHGVPPAVEHAFALLGIDLDVVSSPAPNVAEAGSPR